LVFVVVDDDCRSATDVVVVSSICVIVVDDASLFTRVRSRAEDVIRPDLTITIGFTTANGLLLFILFELSSVVDFGSLVEE
jgi:hypothetical protein